MSYIKIKLPIATDELIATGVDLKKCSQSTNAKIVELDNLLKQLDKKIESGTIQKDEQIQLEDQIIAVEKEASAALQADIDKINGNPPPPPSGDPGSSNNPPASSIASDEGNPLNYMPIGAAFD